MFRKRLTEVGRADLEALIHTGAQEDRTLEFKETLSGRDGNADPWINDQTRIGNFAKRDLTKELVAFANTAGGTLILGMREDGEKRAAELVPLPQCRSLADRLLASIAASTDPNLTALECVGVELDGHQGVVVFRVPMSHLAPHRDKDERECYHRAGDKSEPMTMRQIQERSIASFRGSEQIVGSLNERADAFSVVQPDGVYVLVEGYANIPVKLCGIRATAFPLQPIFIDSLSERRELALVLPSLRSLETQSG